jgi:hypothetical protein
MWGDCPSRNTVILTAEGKTMSCLSKSEQRIPKLLCMINSIVGGKNRDR